MCYIGLLALGWLLLLLQWLFYGGVSGRHLTVGMLMNFDGKSGANLTAEFERKAADLSATFGVGVQLHFHHVNDTSSAMQGALQLLNDNVDVAIGTEHSRTTNAVRSAFLDHGDPPLLIAFCEGSQAMTEDGDPFLVSLHSEESRGAANLRAAEAEGFSHLVYFTDKKSGCSRIPVGRDCSDHTVHGTCITAAHELSRDRSTSDTATDMRNLNLEWFEVGIMDVRHMDAIGLVLRALRARGAGRRYTVFFNGDGLLEDMLAQEDTALLLDNALVVTPLCPPELRVRYGIHGCINVAQGLDALELAVRAAQNVADLRAVHPIKSAAAAIAFVGATGPVQFVGGYDVRRANQTFTVSTVDSAAAALQVVGHVAGAPDAVFNRTSHALWRGRARQGPAIGYAVQLAVVDDTPHGGWFRACQRAADEHNAAVNGTSVGAAPLQDRRFVIQRLTVHTLDQYDPRSVGCLGPVTTRVALQTDPVVGRYVGQPLISLATAVGFSDKAEHPYFIRIMPPDNVQADFLSAVLHHHGWLPVCVMHADSVYGAGLGSGLYKRIASSKATIHVLSPVSVSQALAVLAKIRVQECRTVVVSADSAELPIIVRAAISNDMFPHRNWVVPDTGTTLSMELPGILYSYPLRDADQPIDWLLYTYAHDALHTYAHGIAATLAAGHSPYEGDLLRDAMVRADFPGRTGRVRFDQVTGDRLGVYYLFNVLPSGQKHLVLRQQDAASSLAQATRSTVVEMGTIVYPNNTTEFSGKVRAWHHHLPHTIPPLLVPSFPSTHRQGRGLRL